jgi:hypothetical protein
MSLATFLVCAFYGGLAVLFVWVSVAYRDRPSARDESDAVDPPDEFEPMAMPKNNYSVLNSRRTLIARFD